MPLEAVDIDGPSLEDAPPSAANSTCKTKGHRRFRASGLFFRYLLARREQKTGTLSDACSFIVPREGE